MENPLIITSDSLGGFEELVSVFLILKVLINHSDFAAAAATPPFRITPHYQYVTGLCFL